MTLLSLRLCVCVCVCVSGNSSKLLYFKCAPLSHLSLVTEGNDPHRRRGNRRSDDL